MQKVYICYTLEEIYVISSGNERYRIMSETVIEQINRLKKEKNAVILAHYYVDGEVQAIADYVGDSYFLAKKATTVDADVILFCGVSFMGESAKILNPQKKVVMADKNADCPMAHMVDELKIKEVREQYPDVSVVCYVNSTAEIKALSDVCVTSSNALNLGRYTAEQIPEKHFIFNDGFCHVHKSIHKEELLKAKEAKPEAVVVAHPECTPDVLEEADYIGSTSQIIDYVTESDKKEFIVCTEIGVFYELEQKNPEKKFYSVGHRQFCPNMKRISLEGVAQALETLEPEVELPEDLRVKAELPLKRMLEYAQK